jgi:pimeloyl-ACP methyl ester carboxylesterase
LRFLKYLLLAMVLLAGAAIGAIYLLPGPVTRLYIAIERSLSGLERKEIVTADGLRMVYLEGGKGEPLMLLHGFSDDKDNFVFVAGALGGRYHLIIPDITGFGESERPKGANFGATAQVERLRALAQALKIERLHLGGSSMGGQISLVWAAHHPEEVASLWLLDAGGLRTAPASDMSKTAVPDSFDKEKALAMSDPPDIPKPILDYIGEQRAKNKALEEIIGRDLGAEPPLEPQIEGLSTPSLIVWGKDDHIINPTAAEILHRLLPNSRVVLMNGAGHLPMLEQPERSAADYVAFRASI